MYPNGGERPSLPGGDASSFANSQLGVVLLRVLVLLGGLLIFRALLPQKTKRAATTITPYMNGLDRMLSAQQVSAVQDETVPYESWLASHRANAGTEARREDRPHDTSDESKYAFCGADADAGGAPREERNS